MYVFKVSQWPWVRFIKMGIRGLWLALEDEHTITYSDTIGTLDLPNLVVLRTRVYYMFSGE